MTDYVIESFNTTKGKRYSIFRVVDGELIPSRPIRDYKTKKGAIRALKRKVRRNKK